MTGNRIKRIQISMVVMTVLAVAIAIASRFDYRFLREPLLSMSPFLAMELEMLLTVLVVAACPLGILIEKMASNTYRHFVGLHGMLFALSGAEWIMLPIIFMQFLHQSPIVLGFSETETVIALHIWFYMTLLTYIAMIDIYKVTGRKIEYYFLEHGKISNVWHVCGRVWTVIASVVFVFFILILEIARVFTPVYRDYD